MSTKELLNSIDREDLEKLFEAKRFSQFASKGQHSMFSFKRIKALYEELASKYKVDFEEIISIVREMDESCLSKSTA